MNLGEWRTPNNVDNVVWCCDVKHVHKLQNWKTFARYIISHFIIPEILYIIFFPCLLLGRPHHIFFPLSPANVNYIMYLQPWFDQPSYCTSRSVNKITLGYSHWAMKNNERIMSNAWRHWDMKEIMKYYILPCYNKSINAPFCQYSHISFSWAVKGKMEADIIVECEQ